MGVGHILLIREDALRLAEEKTEAEANAEVGRAVRKICLAPEFTPEPGRNTRRITERVFNHGNGVEWAGAHEAQDKQVFFWARNGLRSLGLLDMDDLRTLRDRVERELRRRFEEPRDTSES